jgi:hypothetical protein
MNSRVVGIGGRMRSGKQEIAKIFEKYGYQRIYFALPLKDLCAEILDISLSELNELKNNNQAIDLTLNKDIIQIISEETKIPYNVVENLGINKFIPTVRELLQFIGTDIIRVYNPNWHVERIKEIINKNKDMKFVIDDLRFPNEKQMIEEFDGICWFVVNPNNNQISNHECETSLKWQDFDHIFVNDKSLSYLKFHWESFVNRYEEMITKRQNAYQYIIDSGKPVEELHEKECDINLLDALLISPKEFNYSSQYTNRNDIKKIEWKNGFVMVYLQNGFIETLNHPLMIEDLKIYV